MWADKGSGCDLGPDYSLRGLTAGFCQLAALPAAQGISPSLLKRNLGSTSQYSLQRVMAKSRNIQTKTKNLYHSQTLTERIPESVLREDENGIQKEGGGRGGNAKSNSV